MSSATTFAEIVDTVAEFISDSDPQTLSIIRTHVNRQYMRIAKMVSWPELQEINETLAFTADSAYLALPHDAAQAIKIIDRSNDWALRRVEMGQMLEDNVARLDNSDDLVIEYSDLGYRATRVPLAAAGTLAIDTEKAGDTSINVLVTGLRSSPEIEEQETITTHASDPVNNQGTGSISWKAGWSISSLSTSAALNGYITVHEGATSGNVLAYLTKRRKSSKYLVLRLQNPPSVANDITVVYKRRVLPMTNDDDVPVIDQVDAIIEATVASMRRYDEQYSQAREHDGAANQFLASSLEEKMQQAPESVRSRPHSRFKWRPRGF